MLLTTNNKRRLVELGFQFQGGNVTVCLLALDLSEVSPNSSGGVHDVCKPTQQPTDGVILGGKSVFWTTDINIVGGRVG